MPKYLAVDSNALTYLLDSVQDGYDPKADPTSARAERVAMLRCFLYGGCSFWVPPTVQREYRRISNIAKREAHDRWTHFLLQDMPLKVSQAILDQRTRELLPHHGNESDCRVVAETEASQLEVLLSSDVHLITRLGPRAKIKILTPTQFWSSLGIHRGARPEIRPAPGNPLALQTWWRLESADDA